MYNPAHFATQEFDQARRLMVARPLALLVGPDAAAQAFGSHLPLTLVPDAAAQTGFVLEGHMARANPHWAWAARQFEQGQQVLAVFSGPSAYVSPRHSDSHLAVPTWNYAAVHVYGQLELIDEPEVKDGLLKRLIAQHEPEYAAQWRALPEDFQSKMLAAIVGFRLRIERWEGKFKLSQNRSVAERGRIRAALAAGSAGEQDIAVWMSELGL